MANSPLVDYRREPVLQHRMGKVSDAFGASSGLTLDEQHHLRMEVIAAFANGQRPIVVVKEPTPLLVDDLVSAVDPQVIFLRRHPLAIAQSHMALGWLPNVRRLDRAGIRRHEREVLHRLWESGSDISKLIAYFAAVESSVRDTLEQIGAVTVAYEALRSGDLGDIAPLFEGLGLDAGDLRAPALDADRTDEYGVGESRQATSVGALGPGILEEAREAWFAFLPTSYTDTADWTSPTAEVT